MDQERLKNKDNKTWYPKNPPKINPGLDAFKRKTNKRRLGTEEKKWFDMSMKDKNLTFEKFFATQYKSQYDWDQAQKVFGQCYRKHKKMTGHDIKKMQIRSERL